MAHRDLLVHELQGGDNPGQAPCEVPPKERFRSALMSASGANQTTACRRASARSYAFRFSGINTESGIRPISRGAGAGLGTDVGRSDMAVRLAQARAPIATSPPPARGARV